MPNIKQQEQEQEHVTKDGRPDHRYKENRDDQDNDYEPGQSDQQEQEHTTKDGHPDHRYKENRGRQDDDQDEENEQKGSGKKGQEQRTKGGQSDNRNSQEGKQKKSGGDDDNDDDDELAKLAHIPTKKDGRPDMRYNESREAVHAGLISQEDVVEEILHEGGHQEQSKGNQRDQE